QCEEEETCDGIDNTPTGGSSTTGNTQNTPPAPADPSDKKPPDQQQPPSDFPPIFTHQTNPIPDTPRSYIDGPWWYPGETHDEHNFRFLQRQCYGYLDREADVRENGLSRFERQILGRTRQGVLKRIQEKYEDAGCVDAMAHAEPLPSMP